MNRSIEFDNSLKKLVRSSSIVFIGLFLSKLFTYVYRVVIAREFGPETYGIFSLANITADWVIIFAALGITEGIARFIPLYRAEKNKDKISYLFRESFFILLFTGIFGGVLLFLLAPFLSNEIFHNPRLIIFLKFFGIFIPFNLILALFSSSLRAHEEIGWYSFINNILISFLNVLLLILFILVGVDSNAIIYSYFFGIVFALLTIIIVSKNKTPDIFKKNRLSNKIKKHIFEEFIKYSWPLVFTGMIWRIFSQTDSFVIGIMKDATQVGIYNSAVPIAFVLQISSQIFIQLFFPLATKEYSKGNREIVKSLSKQVGKWIYMVNLPILILIMIFPSHILSLLFGSSYLEAANSLRILAFGVMFMASFSISNRLIAIGGSSKILLFDIALVSVLNLFLDIILVKTHGLNGAAAATSFSFIILNLLFIYQAKKKTGIIPMADSMLNITYSGIISGAILFGISNFVQVNFYSFIIIAVIFILIYLILILLFGGLDKNDLMILKGISRKIVRKKIRPQGE